MSASGWAGSFLRQPSLPRRSAARNTTSMESLTHEHVSQSGLSVCAPSWLAGLRSASCVRARISAAIGDHARVQRHQDARPVAAASCTTQRHSPDSSSWLPPISTRAAGVRLASLQGVGTFVVQHVLAELLVHPGDVCRRLDLVLALRHRVVDLLRELSISAMNSASSGCAFFWSARYCAHLVAELDVARDPAADVLDEGQRIVEVLSTSARCCFLLPVFVDRGERVADVAGGHALVLRFLPFEVEDVLARPDAQGVAHHVHHRVDIRAASRRRD